MNLQKLVKILVLVIGVVAMFFLVRIMMLGDEAIESDEANQGIVSSYIMLSIVVLIITTVISLIFSLKNILSSSEKLKGALKAIGLFALVVAVAYFLSSGTEQVLDGGEILTASQSHWIEAGIRTFYILVIVAVITMLGFGIKRSFSK